jgi:hypothetical protein
MFYFEFLKEVRSSIWFFTNLSNNPFLGIAAGFMLAEF